MVGMRLFCFGEQERQWIGDLLKNSKWDDYPDDIKEFYIKLTEEMN